MFQKFLRVVVNRINRLWNWINQFIRLCSTIAVRKLLLFWVGSYSFGVRIVRFFFFWVPYSVRNVLKILIFVVNRINQLWNWISQFIRFCSAIIVRALFLIWVSSHSYGVRIVHPCFCWVPYSVSNFITNFEIFSQPTRPIGELNQPVH